MYKFFDFIKVENFKKDKNFITVAGNLGLAVKIGVENISDISFISTGLEKIKNELVSAISNEKDEKLNLIFEGVLLFLKNLDYEKIDTSQWGIFHELDSYPEQLENIQDEHIIPFIFLIDSKTSINGYNNLIQRVGAFIDSSDIEGVKKVNNNVCEDWSWIKQISSLDILSNKLKERLNNDSKFLLYMCEEASYEGANFLMENLDIIVNSEKYGDIFKKLEKKSKEKMSKIDICKYLISNKDLYELDSCKPCFEFLAQNKEERSCIEDINEFIESLFLEKANSIEDADYLIDLCLSNNIQINKILNELKDELDNAISWKIEEVLSFYTVINGFKDKPNDFYDTLFDKAVNRGVTSGIDSDSIKTVALTLLGYWEQNKRYKLKTIKHLKDEISENSILSNEDKEELNSKFNSMSKKLDLDKKFRLENKNI